MDSVLVPASAMGNFDAADNTLKSIDKPIPREPWWAFPAAIFVTLLTLGLDLIMPSGASPDIGYCAAVLLAATTRRLSVLLSFSVICTALTIGGYYLEPHPAPEWMSIFDRCMVMGVVWLTAILGWRRTRIAREMAQQTEVLQKTTRQLARSNEELERFAIVVSHDLRSPLTALGLNLHVLARQLPAHDDEAAHTIADMQGSIDDMSALIRGLLEHGRATNQQLDVRTINVESALTTVLKRLSAAVQSSGANVTHDPLPPVRADQGQFLSLLQNLVENAIKYRGDAPPQIHLSAQAGSEFCTFAIRDNGIGIDPHHQQRIFAMFQRIEKSRGGCGVGLAVCKSIVQRHGGKIWVDSIPGCGSTFFFTLPRAAQAPASAEASLAAAMC
jgi:signal transduction histidine kinase